MTNTDNRLHVEWLVACLSPEDIAPHPNFRTDTASGAELLALIVQFQWQEYATYRDLAAEQGERDLSDLENDMVLDAARAALDSESIRDGLTGLVAAARNASLSLAPRAAAALLAAVAASELDEADAHLALLSEMATLIETSSAGAAASRSLAVAILLQQCALRALEGGRVAEARAFAERVVAALRDLSNGWDDFPVSRGISWPASESQRRLVELLVVNARSLLLSTAEHLDKSWIDIVRAPFPTAAIRPVREALSALTTVVEDEFKKVYSSSKRVRVLDGGDSSIRKLRSSLLNAELTGDLADTAHLRQMLGNVYSVRLANDPTKSDWHAEALRLLRQGDAEDNLRGFLQVIRMRGPLDVLRGAAERLIDTRATQNFVTSADLALVDRAADLISSAHTDRALVLAFKFASQSRGGRVKGSRVAGWNRLETSLKVARALVAGNAEADMAHLASSVVEIVSSHGAGDQFVFSALAQLSSNIDWKIVPAEVKADWLSLLSAASNSPHVLAVDLLRTYSAIGEAQPADVLNRLAGHEFVVALIGGLLGDPPNREAVDKAAAVIVDTINTIRQDVAQGHFSGYAWSPFAMAAYLITRFSRADIWPALLAGLKDSWVPNEDKFNALEVLIDASPNVMLPPVIQEDLASLPIPVTNSDTDFFFSMPADQFGLACRNFYLAYGLIAPDEVQGDILRDAGSRDVNVRTGVARSCVLALAKDSLLQWPQVLLLQLSHDHEALVRNSASKSLAYLSVGSELALAHTVAERVRALLDEPGIAITLGALQGLAAAARDDRASHQQLWCRAVVNSLANEHPSRNVRHAARAVLERFQQPQ